MKKLTSYFAAAVITICAVSCGGNQPFTSVAGSGGRAAIYPDYKDVMVPVNIAPLNYYYAMQGAEDASTTFSVGGKSVTIRGLEVEWRLRKWQDFIADAAGKTISVKASVRCGGQTVEDSWSIFVSADPVDPYLTYRLIEPSYEMWNEVEIRERNVSNFEESVICDHRHTDNACMNCHIHSGQRGDLSMFYIRGAKGGAILNRDGTLRKLNLSADGMLSGTVYGEIHPEGRFGVFSTNIIIPGLHSLTGKRLEVYDTSSDLTIADFDEDRMLNPAHIARADKLETFPCFSADGESVFYCIADTVAMPDDLKALKYDLVRAAFDSTTGAVSEKVDTVWSASAHNASVCHPKTSPDGRWLMFTVADYGTFPLYHTESTLWLIDLQTGEEFALDEIKGDKSDTYHSWSSDSRWFVFASKRGDGQYGKPYFCHLDENGNPSKPFVLPQKSSRFYDINFKSFNIPDLGRSSVGITVRDSKHMCAIPAESFE